MVNIIRTLFAINFSIILVACYLPENNEDSYSSYEDSYSPYILSAFPLDNMTWFLPQQRTIYVIIRDPYDSGGFTDTLDYNSVNNSTLYLKDNLGHLVSGSVNVMRTGIFIHANHYSASFTASSDLKPNTHYTATITKGVKDKHNNALTSGYTWGFTTGPEGYGVWSKMSTLGSPSISPYRAFWTGAEMLIWNSNCSCGGLYNPITDSWRSMSNIGAPEKLWSSLSNSIIWTGSELIVWGGDSYLNTGARYNPTTDSWTTMTTEGAPEARAFHMAVWTGTEMIIWGGYNVDNSVRNYLTSGARYNPTTDTWTPITSTNAPAPRTFANALWTGNEMIVWGGMRNHDSSNHILLNTGARYDPINDTWTSMSQINAPPKLYGNSMVWTGQDIIIWGGRIYYEDNTTELTNSGYRYKPATDTWSSITQVNAPPPRYGHFAFWTGSRMLIWGYEQYGGIYDPITDSWIATTPFGAPSAGSIHAGVWTGSQMIVWGVYSEFHITGNILKYSSGIYSP